MLASARAFEQPMLHTKWTPYIIMAVRSLLLNTQVCIASLVSQLSRRAHHHLGPFRFNRDVLTKPWVATASSCFCSAISRSFSARGARESGSPFINALRSASEVQLINSSMNGFFAFSSPAQKEQFQHCILLVDELGAKVGNMPLNQAIAHANADQRHLSVVAPSAVPPIVKLVSAVSVIANESKKVASDKESRSKKSLEKEIQMMMNIAPNDIQVKVSKILDFCQKGCRVRLYCFLTGPLVLVSHSFRLSLYCD